MSVTSLYPLESAGTIVKKKTVMVVKRHFDKSKLVTSSILILAAVHIYRVDRATAPTIYGVISCGRTVLHQ